MPGPLSKPGFSAKVGRRLHRAWRWINIGDSMMEAAIVIAMVIAALGISLYRCAANIESPTSIEDDEDGVACR
jgi:hypothetical protein